MNRPDLPEILRANPQIDLKRVEQHEAYRAEMSLAGVDLAPVYRITPPIGDQRTRRGDQAHANKQRLVSWGAR